MWFADPFVDEPGVERLTRGISNEDLLGYGEFSAPDYLT